jgi:hypothetical protein
VAISDKSIKLLWSNAAGRCSFSLCDERLTVAEAAGYAPYTLGEMAHIKGNKPGSNRYDVNQTDKERDSYENLILLCPTHHTLIDKAENEERYTVEILHEMKVEHETTVAHRLDGIVIKELDQLKDQLSILLAENHQAWEQYGPLSDNAQRNPNNDAIYALWTSSRLSIIVPNNREAMKLLTENRAFFPRAEQRVVSKFLIHVDSYEKWVKDEIPYQAVVGFPKEFEDLVLGK